MAKLQFFIIFIILFTDGIDILRHCFTLSTVLSILVSHRTNAINYFWYVDSLRLEIWYSLWAILTRLYIITITRSRLWKDSDGQWKNVLFQSYYSITLCSPFTRLTYFCAVIQRSTNAFNICIQRLMCFISAI